MITSDHDSALDQNLVDILTSGGAHIQALGPFEEADGADPTVILSSEIYHFHLSNNSLLNCRHDRQGFQ